MELRADFLIVGSGIAAPVQPRGWRGAGEVPYPHQGRAAGRQHRLRTGRHRGRGRSRRHAGAPCGGHDGGGRRAVRRAGGARARRGRPAAGTPRADDVGRALRLRSRWDRPSAGDRRGAQRAPRVARPRRHGNREIGCGCSGERAAAPPGVTTHDHARVVDFLIEDGRSAGARFLSHDRTMAEARAKLVLLGHGRGRVRSIARPSNPHVATGDGVAMAYRAGAGDRSGVRPVRRPRSPGQPRFLLSEAPAGRGAADLRGRRAFMTRMIRRGSCAA